MAYYGQGDYYGVGDPGIFDFLKKAGRAVVGTVGGAALGFIKGGPGGAIAGAAGGAVGATRANIRAETLAAGGGAIPAAQLKAIHAHRGKGVGGIPASMAVAGHRGHVLMGRKHRHMNVANVHALRRSVRRLAGFYALSHKVMKELGKLVHRRAGHVPRAPAHRPQHLLTAGRKGDFYMGDG